MACGNATCSPKCHTRFFQGRNKCTFHQQFREDAPLVQLRSLTKTNIDYARDNKLALGTLLNRTSRSYLFGMAHPEPGLMYAQRGFRQYGDIEVG